MRYKVTLIVEPKHPSDKDKYNDNYAQHVMTNELQRTLSVCGFAMKSCFVERISLQEAAREQGKG